MPPESVAPVKMAARALTRARAGLDVFEAEPAVHAALLALEHLALTPHVGSTSTATRHRMAMTPR
jgi:gluconate 2-dehydrogenase